METEFYTKFYLPFAEIIDIELYTLDKDKKEKDVTDEWTCNCQAVDEKKKDYVKTRSEKQCEVSNQKSK